ncbi:hypothetical protein [Streptomyces sp. B6B3]|uniref:hypothetical protein n=1 Tax=Streptomyces sp. B6B3 TaxID=3153570 RepID=UPI00325E90B0
MVRKKVEGDEVQRRAAAHQAQKAGETPSARGETTGASKQRTHVSHRSSLSHAEKVAPIHRGKQERHEESARERAAGRAARLREQDAVARGDVEPSSEYTEAHARVFRALAVAESEHGGDAVHLDEVARDADLPRDETHALLRELMSVHRLVTELQGTDVPDQGPRFETKSRR